MLHSVEQVLDDQIVTLWKPKTDALFSDIAIGEEAFAPSARLDYPYPLEQAAEFREFAQRKLDRALDSGSPEFVSKEIDIKHLEGAVASIEAQIAPVYEIDGQALLLDSLRTREIGFRAAGVEQTGLRPPRSYSRIAAVAAGMIVNLESGRVHKAAS